VKWKSIRPYANEWYTCFRFLTSYRTAIIKSGLDPNDYKALIPYELFENIKAYRDYNPFFPGRNIFEGDPINKLIGFELEKRDDIKECRIVKK